MVYEFARCACTLGAHSLVTLTLTHSQRRRDELRNHGTRSHARGSEAQGQHARHMALLESGCKRKEAASGSAPRTAPWLRCNRRRWRRCLRRREASKLDALILRLGGNCAFVVHGGAVKRGKSGSLDGRSPFCALAARLMYSISFHGANAACNWSLVSHSTISSLASAHVRGPALRRIRNDGVARPSYVHVSVELPRGFPL